MKKKSLNIICTALAAAFVLSATGCGANAASSLLSPQTPDDTSGKLIEVVPEAPEGAAKEAAKETANEVSNVAAKEAAKAPTTDNNLGAVSGEQIGANPEEEPESEKIYIEPQIEPRPEKPDTDPYDWIDPSDWDLQPYVDPCIEPYPGYRYDGGPVPETGKLQEINYQTTNELIGGDVREAGYHIVKTTDPDYPYEIDICVGPYPTGGYNLYISDLFYASDLMIITVMEETPEAGSVVTQAFTYPSCAIRLSKLPEEILVADPEGGSYPLNNTDNNTNYSVDPEGNITPCGVDPKE